MTGSSSSDVGMKASDCSSGLLQLLDGLVWLYHVGAHKQYLKMGKMRETFTEYTATLKDLHKNMENAKKQVNKT